MIKYSLFNLLSLTKKIDNFGSRACYGGPLMNLILGTGLATLVTGLTGDLEEPIPRESSYGVLSLVT